MRVLWQEVRYGLRTLLRSRGYAVVMVLTLALGIGATTAIFSLVKGVLLRPLAYPQSQQLVFIGEFISALADKYPVLPVNARHFLEWRQRCSSFESLSLVGRNDVTMTGKGEPECLEALEVSANLFGTLRVPPALGQVFTAEDEEGSSSIAVISDGLWRRKFGADPAILGETITLNDKAYAIVGVLPPAFRFPNVNAWAAAALQTSAQPAIFVPKVFTERERNELIGHFGFGVIARLKEGVTREQATAELNMIGTHIMDLAALKDLELRAIVQPLKEMLVHDSRRGLLVVLGAIGTLLLIACLNLGILSLARAQHREAEGAIRAALGATRRQLVRQALVEAVLIALLGSAAGVALATQGLGVLVRIAPGNLPRLSEVSIDAGVLVFALELTGATALLFGIFPAWCVAGARAEQVLQAGRRTATTGVAGLGLRNVLVAAEVALGVALLITAGLLLDSFARVLRADLGFQAPTVLAGDVALPPAKGQRAMGYHDRLLEHLASAPGVSSAALVSALPLEGESWVDVVGVPGDPRPQWQWPLANLRVVSAGYFRTMDIPLLEGRTFDPADRVGAGDGRARRPVVVSERLARTLWPRQDTVVGQKVLLSDEKWEVIGVVSDVRAHADRAAVPTLYRVYWNLDLPNMTIVARTSGNPLAMAGALRAAVHQADADVPITKLRTMREVLEGSVSQRYFQTLLTFTFALCALLLAGFGVYGVISYSVTRRTREMGIRAAFGAGAPELCTMVLRQGMIPVVFGLAFGVGGALVSGRLLRSLLYEVKPHDPWIIAVAIVTVLLTALLACWLPARRAAGIDPMAALKCE